MFFMLSNKKEKPDLQKMRPMYFYLWFGENFWNPQFVIVSHEKRSASSRAAMMVRKSQGDLSDCQWERQAGWYDNAARTDMITTYKKKDIYRKWYEHGMSSPNKYRLGHRLLWDQTAALHCHVAFEPFNLQLEFIDIGNKNGISPKWL